MNYSVFILYGDDQSQNTINEFINNTDIKTHLASAATSAVSDMVGFDVWDTYANKLKNDRSVALTDNITEMTFNTSKIFLKKYQIGDHNMTDVGLPVLKHTLTVKGKLEFPNILFALGIKTAQKKDTSKIWNWATTPLENANSQDEDIKKSYYRHVVATVFAPDERQFRAIILRNAFVGSYDEYFDQNGEGHFTLVINKMIVDPVENAQNNEPEIEAQGPNFGWTFSSVTGDIAKAAKTGGKLIEDTANVTEKVLGKDNEAVKRMHNVAKLADKGGDDIQNVLSDGSAFNPDNIAQEIEDNAKLGRDTKHLYDGDKESEETTTKPETKYLPDGSTETKITKTNPDGSKDIEITIEKLDKTKIVKKEHEDHSGFNDW